MAAILALGKATSSSPCLFPRLVGQLRLACHAPSLFRSFNSTAQTKRQDEDEDEDEEDDMNDLNADGRHLGNRSAPRFSAFFPDAGMFVPFTPARKLGEVLNLMDQLTEDVFPAAAGAPRGAGSTPRRGWEAKEDGEVLYLRMDMPGLGKEQVKVTVEENMLTVKGVGSEEEKGRKYTTRMELPEKEFKVGEIKAEMKNGVLKVVVPKVKQEDRKDIFHVQVE